VGGGGGGEEGVGGGGAGLGVVEVPLILLLLVGGAGGRGDGEAAGLEARLGRHGEARGDVNGLCRDGEHLVAHVKGRRVGVGGHEEEGVGEGRLGGVEEEAARADEEVAACGGGTRGRGRVAAGRARAKAA